MKGLVRTIILISIALWLSACSGSSSDPLDLRNDAPEVHITAPASVDRGAEVTLDGSSSEDAENKKDLTYLWQQRDTDLLNVTLSGPDTSIATFTPPSDQVESVDLHFTLTVTDLEGKSSSRTVTIHVIGSADAGEVPTAVISAPTAVGLNTTIELDGSGSFDNNTGGTIASWQWSLQKPDDLNASLTNATSSKANLTMPEQYIGSADLVVTLRVTDNDGRTNDANVTIQFAGTPAYKVSGTVTVVSGSHMDSDINHPRATYVANDTLDTPQVINNPSRVAGYVNRAGAGPNGRSKTNGDRRDFFKISMLEGQSVVFRYFVGSEQTSNNIAFNDNDLDLFLYDESQNLVNVGKAGVIIEVATSTTETERQEVMNLTAPSSGEFILEVYAGRGAGNYHLEVVNAVQQLQAGELNLNADFVAGEAIVKTADGASVQQKNSRGSELGVKLLAGENNDVSLYLLKGANRNASDIQAKIDTLDLIAELRQRSDVEYAEPNYIIQAAVTTPNDPLFASQWHYQNINLPDAWDISQGSSDVVVAVIDTGIHVNHPDVPVNIANGYDFVKDTSNSGDGDGIDSDPTDNSTGLSHGTHVAGTIVSSSHNNAGVSGVSWNSSLMPVRALGLNGGTAFDVTQSILYSAGLANNSGITLNENQRADVINMSLVGYGYSQLMQDSITAARTNDVVVVAASGNDSLSLVGYPAAYDGVIAVGATDRNDAITLYSNSGDNQDVVAPGGDVSTGASDGVLSLFADGTQFDYAYANGTSMAAPHVAGVVALMKAVYPQLTPQQLDDWLEGGVLTNDLGNYGRDNTYGNGIIDALKSLQIAQLAANNEPINLPPRVSISPQLLNYEYDFNELPFVIQALSNDDGDTLTIQSVTALDGWLSIDNSRVIDGYGIYEASIARSQLPSGLVTSTIVILMRDLDGVEQRAEITVFVNNSVQVPSVFSLLDVNLYDDFDVGGRTAVYSVQAVPVDGSPGVYRYQFDAVEEGKYDLKAQTNMDNDGLYNAVHFDPVGVPADGDLTFSILDVVRDIVNFNFSIDI